MSSTIRRLLAGALFVALLALSFEAYRRWFLHAPPGAFVWNYRGIEYRLLDPRFFAVLLVVPFLFLGLRRSLADLPWQQRLLGFLFRVGFFLALALGLSRPAQTDVTSKVSAVFLVDVSRSVEDSAVEDARSYVARALREKPEDARILVVAFAARPKLVELKPSSGDPELPGVAELRADTDDAADGAAGSGSDLQAALQLAYGLFPAGYLKRAVLLSDGLETRGNVLSEAHRARELGVIVHSVPYEQAPPAEVALVALEAPERVKVGETFELVGNVYATRPSRARARLYQGETLNGLDGVRELELQPGKNEIRFKSVVRVSGEVTYDLKLDEVSADKFTENNRYSVTLDVPGRPGVLYVEGQPKRASYFASALRAQQFDVDIRAPSAFPGSIKELERYDFVVLSDVPRELVGVGAQNLIEQYVRDLGGGFLFAGGEAGFGLGGWAHTTIERILPVRMDSERQKETPSVAMVLLIDRSGSMSGLPLEMAKEACRATVATLQADDVIEVIAFDHEAVRYVKMQPARYRARIQNEIARIQPGGGTEIFSSLDMAYQDISVVEARKKHVILLTDGEAPSQGIQELVQAMLAESITVTTVGIGSGTNPELLRMIADTGGGRFHSAPDPNSLPKIFTRETELVARQAAVEEWFPVSQAAPAAFLQGVAVNAAPLLHGYVATQAKPAPAQVVLVSDRGEPILARWRVGLGWSLAWTSDVKNLWAVDWLRWPGYPKFWGQLVREHMRKKQRNELPMITTLSAGRVTATVDAFTLDERFDNNLDSMLYVKGPMPAADQRQAAFRQIAPGRYEAKLELDRYGTFVVQALHGRVDAEGVRTEVGVSYGHVSNPYPEEFARFEPDPERLRGVAAAAGGQFAPPPGAVFDAGGQILTYRSELWSRSILLALAFFLLDLLVRRVRLFDRKFVARKRDRRAA